MEITKNTILEVVRQALTPEQIERSFVYWDSTVRKKGSRLRAGPLGVTMPFDAMLVFVDLAPRYNWAHPCLYLLVDVNDLHTHLVPASFTPYSRGFPETVTILLRYGAKPPHGRYFQIFGEETEGGTT